MTFLAKAGSFNITTGAASSTVSVTDVGFTPKVVFFWWSGRTESTDTTNGIDIKAGFGAMVSSTERGCVSMQMDDGAATMATDRMHRDDSCIGSLTTAGAVDGLADFSSFDTDTGFTVVIDDAFSTNLRISYLALGGSDITNVALSFFDFATSGNPQDITSLSFQPDAVVFFSANITGDINNTATGASLLVSAAAGETPSNIVAEVFSQDALADSSNRSWGLLGRSVARDSRTSNAVDGAASVSEWLSNGFRLSVPNLPTFAVKHLFVALKGGSYTVGESLTQTDTTTDIVVSGLDYQPSGGLVLSCCGAEDGLDNASSGLDISIGGFSSTTSRCAQGVQEENGTMAAESAASLELDAVYTNISTADALEGLMDVKSVDSGGVTFIMDDADPSQNWFGYLLFGPTVDTGTTLTPDPKAVTLSAPAITTSRQFLPTAAAITLSAPSTTVSKTLALSPIPAAITLSAPDPTLSLLKTLSPSAAPLTLSAPTVTTNRSFLPDAAVTTLTSPSVSVSLVKTLSPDPVVVSLSSPAVTTNRQFLPNVATITLTPPSVTQTSVYTVSPSAATISISAPTPAVTQGASISPDPSVVTLSAPSVSISHVKTLSPDPAVASISAQTITTNRNYLPTPVSVSLSAPSVALSFAKVISPDPAILNVTGVSPQLLKILNLSPTSVSTSITAQNVNVVLGAKILSPSPVSLPIISPQPTLSFGAVTLTPDPAVLTLAAFNITIPDFGTGDVVKDPIGCGVVPFER